jgi:carbon-monoxide dehydrogenase medium subunit
MYLKPLEYFAPKTPAEAFDLLGKYGADARILAGGTDLMVLMKNKAIAPKYIVDISRIPDFQGIKVEPGKGATIGATTKIADIEYSKELAGKYKALVYAASQLGSSQVRHMGTLGGNTCNASPAGETPPPLVAYGAKVVVTGPKGDRELPLEDFILGVRKIDLNPGEILARYVLPEPAPKSGSAYTYMGARNAVEIDSVNVAVNLTVDGDVIKTIKFVLGSVFIKPIISQEIPKLLLGQKLTDDLLEKAAAAARGEAKPIADIRATKEYRDQMIGVLTRRALKEAYAAAKEAK